jgi:hypothetical protein
MNEGQSHKDASHSATGCPKAGMKAGGRGMKKARARPLGRKRQSRADGELRRKHKNSDE